LQPKLRKILVNSILVVLFILSAIFFSESYSWGNGFHGESYCIFVNHLFIYTFDTDVGRADWAIGFINRRFDRYTFHALYHRNSELVSQFPVEFTQVDWTDRRYLIQKDKMISFCNSVNQGREPRSVFGSFLLRSGDE